MTRRKRETGGFEPQRARRTRRKKRRNLTAKGAIEAQGAQRATRSLTNTRSLCGLCVSIAPFAVKFFQYPTPSVQLHALRVSVVTPHLRQDSLHCQYKYIPNQSVRIRIGMPSFPQWVN